MTQADLVLLLFRIGLCATTGAVIWFIAYYTKVAPWWRNEIGRTIVIKDLVLLVPLLLSIVSAFWGFNRYTSQIAGWITVVSFFGMAVVMVWRIAVWRRIHRGGKPPAELGDPA